MDADKVTLICGDALEELRKLPDCSVDTVITDPPAGISFMGKDWDHHKGGRMQWIAWLSEILCECLRVAKPGASLLCWSIPRTSHWTGSAIEDAGWEVRDVITHLFGSGFPKSANISKQIDKAEGAEREVIGTTQYADGKTRPAMWSANGSHDGWKRPAHENYNGDRITTAPATDLAREWDGWGTALKPAAEFWWLAMKPLEGTFAENAEKWGVAGLNVGACRIKGNWARNSITRCDIRGGALVQGRSGGIACEPQECHPSGRWPANVTHDGSAEVLAGFPVTSQNGYGANSSKPDAGDSVTYGMSGLRGERGHNDTSSAARFFYCAKASRSEREAGLEGMPEAVRNITEGHGRGQINTSKKSDDGIRENRPTSNHHPCVKPLALMEWLCKLTSTPSGGVVLDPFMGSGTTGVACARLGRRFIGIDCNSEYIEIARRRIEHENRNGRLPLWH